MTSEREALTVKQFVATYGVCRAVVFNELRDGRLAGYKVGRRRYISARAASEWQQAREKEDKRNGNAGKELP